MCLFCSCASIGENSVYYCNIFVYSLYSVLQFPPHWHTYLIFSSFVSVCSIRAQKCDKMWRLCLNKHLGMMDTMYFCIHITSKIEPNYVTDVQLNILSTWVSIIVPVLALMKYNNAVFFFFLRFFNQHTVLYYLLIDTFPTIQFLLKEKLTHLYYQSALMVIIALWSLNCTSFFSSFSSLNYENGDTDNSPAKPKGQTHS